MTASGGQRRHADGWKGVKLSLTGLLIHWRSAWLLRLPSNLISHSSAGSSQGTAHHKVSDACSVLSIVAAQCLAGCRWPRSQRSARDAAPFAEGSCSTEEALLRELIGPEHLHWEQRAVGEIIAMANTDGINHVCNVSKLVLPTTCYIIRFCSPSMNCSFQIIFPKSCHFLYFIALWCHKRSPIPYCCFFQIIEPRAHSAGEKFRKMSRKNDVADKFKNVGVAQGNSAVRRFVQEE